MFKMIQKGKRDFISSVWTNTMLRTLDCLVSREYGAKRKDQNVKSYFICLLNSDTGTIVIFNFF